MTIDEIKKNAPSGATHYTTRFKTVFYVKMQSHYIYWWKFDFDKDYHWSILGCRSIVKIKKLKPL